MQLLLRRGSYSQIVLNLPTSLQDIALGQNKMLRGAEWCDGKMTSQEQSMLRWFFVFKLNVHLEAWVLLIFDGVTRLECIIQSWLRCLCRKGKKYFCCVVRCAWAKAEKLKPCLFCRSPCSEAKPWVNLCNAWISLKVAPKVYLKSFITTVAAGISLKYLFIDKTLGKWF